MPPRIGAEHHARRPVSPRGKNLGVLWVCLFSLLVVHNAEELLLGLPAWTREHPWFPDRVSGSYDTFIPAVVVVICAGGVLAVYAVLRRPRWSRPALIVATGLLALNAVSHIVASLVTQTVMPGLYSSVLIVVPCLLFLLWRLSSTARSTG